jgi:hypothetical protein
VLRAYWLGPTDGMEQTRQIGITVERRVPRALALRPRVEDLPLTGREKQLCLLLTQDRSRQELGEAMGVSTGTFVSRKRSRLQCSDFGSQFLDYAKRSANKPNENGAAAASPFHHGQ